MDFNVNDWLGDWISFEHLINNHDPNLDRAWKDSTKAMRSKPLFAIMMLGDARRFWQKPAKPRARSGDSALVDGISSSRPQLATMMLSQALT